MRNFMLLATAVLLMSACSNDDTPAPVPDNQTGKISFEISAVEQLDVTTKSPVYSQENVQHITDVKVYAFKQTGADFLYVKTYDITGWSDGTDFKRYAVNDADMLTPGTYQFVAVGRNNPNLFTITTDPTTKYQDFKATITASGNESELFSGSASSVIVDDGNRVNISMTRQIAGILGYFKNVPQQYKNTTVKYLRLTVTNANKAVSLVTGVGSDPLASSFRLIDVDLTTQSVQNDVYTGNDLGSSIIKLPNTQLNGLFLMPVNAVSMTLGLYDANGNALKEWVVNDTGNLPVFNISPNHFYSLGMKTKTNSTDGGTPGDPSDDDNPIDLMTDQNISITILPNWTLIHNMTIQ